MYTSKNFNGKKFVNSVPTVVSKPGTTWNTLRQLTAGGQQRTPAKQLGPFKTEASQLQRVLPDQIRITWFGHSSALLEIDGQRFLTDPVWSKRSSPVDFAGPARFFAPTLALADMPALDGILISHDHFDQFRPGSVAATQPNGRAVLRTLGRGRASTETTHSGRPNHGLRLGRCRSFKKWVYVALHAGPAFFRTRYF